MRYQIISLATRKDILGEAVDADTLTKLMPDLLRQHDAVIIREYNND